MSVRRRSAGARAADRHGPAMISRKAGRARRKESSGRLVLSVVRCQLSAVSACLLTTNNFQMAGEDSARSPLPTFRNFRGENQLIITAFLSPIKQVFPGRFLFFAGRAD